MAQQLSPAMRSLLESAAAHPDGRAYNNGAANFLRTHDALVQRGLLAEVDSGAAVITDAGREAIEQTDEGPAGTCVLCGCAHAGGCLSCGCTCPSSGASCPCCNAHDAPDSDEMLTPCQPIGCDNGYHLSGCPYAPVDDDSRPAGVDPVAVLAQLGAKWSPDLDAYTAGELDASQIRCALCANAPCQCPPFGTPEYLALVDRRHGKGRRS